MRSLSETFNVNYFLVSQTNPHIVPLMNLKKRVPRKLGNFVETEWKHRWGVEQDRLACCFHQLSMFKTAAAVQGAGATLLHLALLFVPFIATPMEVCLLVTAVQAPHVTVKAS